MDWSVITEIEILGLDEIALKKGHRDYVTLVTGRLRDGEIMILGVLPGYEKAEVIEFLRLIPRENRSNYTDRLLRFMGSLHRGCTGGTPICEDRGGSLSCCQTLSSCRRRGEKTRVASVEERVVEKRV